MGEDAAPDVGSEIVQAWRTNVLNVLLTVAAVLAVPAVAVVVAQATREPENWPAAFAFLSLTFLLIGLAVFRRLDMRLRAWGLLLVGYAAGVLSFMRGGLAGDGRVYIMALPIVALIMVGERSGLVMTVLSLLTYTAFALFAHLGWLENWLILKDNPLTLGEWLNEGTGLALSLLVPMVLLWYFSRFQARTLEAERRAVIELAQTSSLLRRRAGELEKANRQLARRAQQIETSAKIGQAATRLLNLDELLAHAVELVQNQFAYYQVSIFLPDESERWVKIQSSSGRVDAELMKQSAKIRIDQESVVGRAGSRREPYTAQEVSSDPLYRAHPLLPDTRSEIALPLIVGDKLIGVLDIQSNVLDAFDEESLSVLQAIANQLAIAIENAQKFLDEASILEETSAFHRYSRAISMAASDAQVGQALMDYTASTPVEVGRLLLIENDPAGVPTWITMMEGWTVDDRPAQPLGVRLRLEDYPLEQLVSENEVVIIEDVKTDPRANEMTQMTFGIAGIRSAAVIPLHSGDMWLGNWFIGRNEPSIFEPRLMRSYQSLANQAAVVMESIRLLETTQQQARREQTISNIVRQLRSSATVEQVLESTVQQIGQSLDASRVAVRLHPRPRHAANNGPQP